jgi:mevalonate kinase
VTAQASVPGKLILAGEHAVVYGSPAIAFAVNRLITATAEPDGIDTVTITSEFCEGGLWGLSELAALRMQLERRYRQYKAGQLPIEAVLERPVELLAYAAALGDPAAGLRIHVESQLAIGAGMGSSAAACSAVIQAVAQTSGKSLAPFTCHQLVSCCEALQHGRPSGLDVATILKGGIIWYKTRNLESLPGWLPRLYLWHSGRPASTTGECVEHVRQQQLPAEHWQEFANIANVMRTAIETQNEAEVRVAMSANQRLLETLGVVPKAVADEIAAIEAVGAAAKISGAGSIAGDTAGSVLIAIDDPARLPHLTLEPLTIWSRK